MWKVLAVLFGSCVLAISAKSCTITLPQDIKGFSPVILTESSATAAFDLFRPTGQVNKFKEDSLLKFVCTGKNNLIMNLGTGNSVDLKCSDGKFVDAKNKTIALNTLVCKSIPESTLQMTTTNCSNDRGLIHEAGIQIGNTFHRVFEICYNKDSQTTFYAHNTLNGAGIKYHIVESTRRPFQATGMKFTTTKVNELYTKTSQLEIFKKYFGEQQTYIDNGTRYLARGHLTPDADFIFGYEQLATYFYINAAPQYQCVNGCNWKSVEMKSRALAGAYGDDIEAYNGYFGILQLPKPSGTKVNVYLDDKQEFPVPKYYFKVLMRKSVDAAVVIVSVNNPFITDGKPEEVCKNVCDEAKLNHRNFNNLKKGYTFCCTLDDFKKVYNGLPAEVQANKLLTAK